MGLWDETRDIEQLDRDEASSPLTGRVLRLTRTAELVVRASFPNERYASIRLDCRERVVCNLDRRQRGRGEERGLADVRFPDDPQLHGVRTEIVLEVP